MSLTRLEVKNCSPLTKLVIEERQSYVGSLLSMERSEDKRNDKTLVLEHLRDGDPRADVGGGDSWQERGEKGILVRVHRTPRRALFTPFKVARGLGPEVDFADVRWTIGVDDARQEVEVKNAWRSQTGVPSCDAEVADWHDYVCYVFSTSSELDLEAVFYPSSTSRVIHCFMSCTPKLVIAHMAVQWRNPRYVLSRIWEIANVYGQMVCVLCSKEYGNLVDR